MGSSRADGRRGLVGRSGLIAFALAAAVVAASTGPAEAATTGAAATTAAPAAPPVVAAGAQRIGIPLYVDPSGSGLTAWDTVRAAAPTAAIVIANPASGPGRRYDATYRSAISAMQASGVKVIGYVATGYGSVSLSKVKAQIDSWYTWYQPDGIFLDEVPTSTAKLANYQSLYNFIKAKTGNRLVVLNPGTNTSSRYLSAGDIIVIFEDGLSAYLAWQPASWVASYPPERFWHLIIGTPSADLGAVVSRSKSLNAGYVYVTDDDLPNPWDSVATYWTAEKTAVAA